MAGLATAAMITGGASVLGGIGKAIMGGAARRRARRRQRRLERQITALENNRQDIIDPFAGAASQLTNPFANLTVATQAAEFQAQQTDLSLSSTLDTLRATGTGAGGATALAQAALQAKQGVSASIAQQEAQNEKLRAQGQQQLERALFDAEAKGKQFVFGATERREMQKLNRLSAMAGGAQQQAASAEQSMIGGIGEAIGGIGSFALAGGFGGGGPFGGGSGAASGTPVDFGGSVNMTGIGGQLTTSDRRLKNNIKLIGYSPSGLKIYNFSYIGDNKVYQGVMSDEIPQHAVVKGNNGYDKVYYDKIDVEFKLIK